MSFLKIELEKDQESEKCDKPVFHFPDTLEEFGYRFIDGKLLHIETGMPFKYEEEKGNDLYNMRRYQALGDVVTNYVYDYVRKNGNLVTMLIHKENALSRNTSTFFFHSKDAFKKSKVIVLVQEYGIVRAGQWSRRLIIKDSLDTGTQLPYIQKAQELGYGVFVLNPNDNEVEEENEAIREYTLFSHVRYVLKGFILPSSEIKHIALICHGSAGLTIKKVFTGLENELHRFFAIAFIDSPHDFSSPSHKIWLNWFREHSHNWVCSHKPLRTPILKGDCDYIDCISAGTNVHELAPSVCMESVFDFINKKYAKTVCTKRK